MAKKRQRKRSQKKRQVTPPPQRLRPWLMGLILLLVGTGIFLWSPWSQPGSVPPGAIITTDQSAPAPPFTLASAAGEQIKLADYLGQQPVVLAFYMGDFWASCRQQLGQLQRRLASLQQAGAVVMGISIDSPGVAQRTSGRLGLKFPLLSDPPMRIIRQYDMTGQGMNMAHMGYVIIDRQGRIRVRQVDPQFGEHAKDILAIIEHLDTA